MVQISVWNTSLVEENRAGLKMSLVVQSNDVIFFLPVGSFNSNNSGNVLCVTANRSSYVVVYGIGKLLYKSRKHTTQKRF